MSRKRALVADLQTQYGTGMARVLNSGSDYNHVVNYVDFRDPDPYVRREMIELEEGDVVYPRREGAYGVAPPIFPTFRVKRAKPPTRRGYRRDLVKKRAARRK